MEFLILAFATFYVTTVLSETHGPKGVFTKLRNKIGMLGCHTCVAVYVGAVFALYIADNPLHWLIITLALAGASTFLNRLDF